MQAGSVGIGFQAGVLISHTLGGEIVFYHAPVAIQQGSNDWPLQI
ncbi:aspartate carbamoyltransferase [Desmospora sp. 8437]|nr:aspartate carbamoyltransferase [Desmospora sp. 8437]